MEASVVRNADDLEAQLLGLPPHDRARLAEVLLASLDRAEPGLTSTEIEAAWIAEGERRLAELRAGTVAGIPADEVFSRIERRLQR
jgi:putative addiction module component (TIGR02574 family)